MPAASARLATVLLLALWVLPGEVRSAEPGPPLVLERTIPLPGVSGRIDHMAVDLRRGRLFVAELGNGTIDVVDLAEGKAALAQMTPLQILATSALGLSPFALNLLLPLQDVARPPFNLIISNVPGPRRQMYLSGGALSGLYPLSIPFQGQALNITCTTYGDDIGFGLVGCRRRVPHLQRLLGHLDDELGALERAVGVA